MNLERDIKELMKYEVNLGSKKLVMEKIDFSESKSVASFSDVYTESNATKIVAIQNDKGSSGKTFITELIAGSAAIASLKPAIAEGDVKPSAEKISEMVENKKPLHIVIASIDVNECLQTRLTKEYLEKQCPATARINLVAINNTTYVGDEIIKKSENQANHEISSSVKSGDKLTLEQLKGVELENPANPLIIYFIEEDGSATPIDILIYDKAAGIDNLKGEKAHVIITPMKTNEIDSMKTGLNNIVRNLIIRHKKAIDMLKKSNIDIKNKNLPDQQILDFKIRYGEKHIIVLSKADTRGAKTREKLLIAEIKRIEEYFCEEIEYVFLPNMHMDVFREHSINPYIPREQFKKLKISKVHCFEDRIDMIEGQAKLLKTVMKESGAKILIREEIEKVKERRLRAASGEGV